MRPSSAATSNAIGVLIADSNRMQAQLLTSALRRHSEFRVQTCEMDTFSILQSGHCDPVIEPVHPRLRNRDHAATLSPLSP